MHSYGFSTGALARGDFRHALRLLSEHDVVAVELSALRDHELPALVESLSELDLSGYEYVSVHAPSRFSALSESDCAHHLSRFIDLGWPVILHPDAIQEPRHWSAFGDLLCIENMDKRKPDGRTADELQLWFDRFPEASFCLDLGHARQVDPSLTLTRKLIRLFGSRLKQIHLSELDVRSHHCPLSMGAVRSLRRVANRLGNVAVIIESCVEEGEIGRELEMARLALDLAAEPTAP